MTDDADFLAEVQDREELRKPIPAKGARYFPDEGGIQYDGRTFYPADYVATRNDLDPLYRTLLAMIADRDTKIAAVLALHQPLIGHDVDGAPEGGYYCDHCGGKFPCPAVRALGEE